MYRTFTISGRAIAPRTIFAFTASLLVCSLITFFSISNKLDYEAMTMERLIMEKSAGINEVVTKLLFKTHTLASLVIQSNGVVRDFDRVAATIVDDPAILNVLLAPGNVVSHVYPLRDNTAVLGFDMRDDSAGNIEAAYALKKGELVVAGPFLSTQGFMCLAGRLPVWLPTDNGEKKFWGLVSVTLRYPEALAGARLDALELQGFSFNIWRVNPDDGKRQVIAQSKHYGEGKARFIEKHIQIYNASWYFRIAPIYEWYQYGESWLLILAALFMSLLIAAVTQNNARLSLMKDNLETMVKTDSLTGSLNRKGLFEALTAAIAGDRPFLLHYMDLNYFKQINDAFGHNTGDRVLTRFCEVIRRCTGPEHVFARISGDEFVLVNKAPTEAEEEKFWSDIDKALSDPLCSVEGEQIVLSFSRGTARFPDDGVTIDDLISLADSSMYQAKHDKYKKERKRRATDIRRNPAN